MKKLSIFAVTLFLCLTVGLSGQAIGDVTPFSQDVYNAIDDGLQWMRDVSAFTSMDTGGGYYGRRGCRGLSLLALLEKRASADFDADVNGYSGSSAGDQGLAQSAVQLILQDTTYGVPRSFYAYYHGQNMMALSLYASTGGPEVTNTYGYTLRSAIDKMVNEAINAQTKSGTYSGFWGYAGGGSDSSTTQFSVAGLAAAKGYYTWVDDITPGGDAAAVTQIAAIDTALARTAAGYWARQNADGGEGYQVGSYSSSYQQTGSGLWCELLGGFDLNHTAVQAKLGWLYNWYNYASTSCARNSWPQAYYYYLWSSSKAYTLIEDSEIDPTGSNITTSDLGTLEPATGCRLLLRDPETDTRPAPRGSGGTGYYSGEQPRWYYDYAYTIMTRQYPSGQLYHNQGMWNLYVDHAYAILVLERSLGGACKDTDGDGVCDSDDNCPTIPNPSQEDQNNNGVGDACDNCPDDLAARPKSGKVQLTWTYDGVADLFKVYRSTTMGGPYALIASTTSTYSTYLDTGLTNNTTYYYVLESELGGVVYCVSDEISATPIARVRR